MVYITGDIHASIDIKKLNSKNFPEGLKLTKDDYVIICGDFGLIWDNEDNITGEEKYWTEWLTNKPWTTLFLDGNHENHPRLNSYPIEEKFGGKVHKINDSIYHLMRGEYYKIDKLTYWTFGGAQSHDKWHRTEGVSWWKEEMPTTEEMQYGVDKLKEHNNKVDIILTHCAPYSIISSVYEKDPLTSYFDFIKDSINYSCWMFGHYHIDKIFEGKHIAVYDSIWENTLPNI